MQFQWNAEYLQRCQCMREVTGVGQFLGSSRQRVIPWLYNATTWRHPTTVQHTNMTSSHDCTTQHDCTTNNMTSSHDCTQHTRNDVITQLYPIQKAWRHSTTFQHTNIKLIRNCLKIKLASPGKGITFSIFCSALLKTQFLTSPI